LSDTLYDVIVLGAGCSGLSLAHQYLKTGRRDLKVLWIEERDRYVHDRVWCHWDQGEGLVEEEWVSQRWNRIALTDGERSVSVEIPQTPYCLVESGSFYGSIQEEILSAGHLKLQLGARVLAPPVIASHGFRIETLAGDYHGKRLLDTRPRSGPLEPPGLWQSFLGWEIEVDGDVFDPCVATLMDFERSSSYVLEFLYLLPRSKKRAIFEWTVFDPRPIPPDRLEARLRSRVRKVLKGISFRLLRTESGVVPMGSMRKTGFPQVIDCSLGAGMARAATGYAFSSIQRWAKACAQRLALQGELLPPLPTPPWIRWMDDHFLRRIQRHPNAAPDYLMDLFERTPSEQLIGFLEGRPMPHHLLSVMQSQIPGYFRRKTLARS
jgi:lycopene beta-cyclase